MGEKILIVFLVMIKLRLFWIGKQVIDIVLKNIKLVNCGDFWMQFGIKIKVRSWGDYFFEEGEVVVWDGIFVYGILDKLQFGFSDGGFVYVVYEVYGFGVVVKLLSCLGCFFICYFVMVVFICGMDDLCMILKGEQDCKELIKEVKYIGFEVVVKYVFLEE